MTTELEEKLAKRVFDLETELDAIRQMITICANCHQIKNERDEWQKIENFLRNHFGMQFSHGICPDCKKKLYPQLCSVMKIKKTLK